MRADRFRLIALLLAAGALGGFAAGLRAALAGAGAPRLDAFLADGIHPFFVGVCTLAVGLVLLVRRALDPTAWLLFLTHWGIGTSLLLEATGRAPDASIVWFPVCVAALAAVAFLVRFGSVPGLFGPAALLVGAAVALDVIPGGSPPGAAWPLATCVVALGARRRAPLFTRRLQLGWCALGFGVAALCTPLAALISPALGDLGWLAVPAAAAVSVLKLRLLALPRIAWRLVAGVLLGALALGAWHLLAEVTEPLPAATRTGTLALDAALLGLLVAWGAGPFAVVLARWFAPADAVAEAGIRGCVERARGATDLVTLLTGEADRLTRALGRPGVRFLIPRDDGVLCPIGPGGVEVSVRVPAGGALAGLALAFDAPFFEDDVLAAMSDARGDSQERRILRALPGGRTEAFVPCLARGRVVALLQLGPARDGRPMSATVYAALATDAPALAVALEPLTAVHAEARRRRLSEATAAAERAVLTSDVRPVARARVRLPAVLEEAVLLVDDQLRLRQIELVERFDGDGGLNAAGDRDRLRLLFRVLLEDAADRLAAWRGPRQITLYGQRGGGAVRLCVADTGGRGYGPPLIARVAPLLRAVGGHLTERAADRGGRVVEVVLPAW
jgi:hypothetical protein